MTNPDPVQVAYDVLEDVMTPAADDPGGYWLSDLPPDLLAQRIVTALRDHLTSEDTCRRLVRRLVHARLAHYGYTTEQIAEAEKDPEHTDACERTEQGWHCYDEHDRSLHPLQDALDEAAEAVRWTLDQIEAMLGGPNAPLIDATEETPHMRAALRAIALLEAEIRRIAAVVRRHDGDQWHECTSERECMDALRRQATPRTGGSDGQPA